MAGEQMMRDHTPPELPHEVLARHLADAGLDSRFRDMKWSFVGRFSNEVWRLDLDNGVRLVTKTPYRPPRADDAPDIERAFYRLLADRADLPIPRFVANLDGTLILEYHDLAPFSFEAGVTGRHADAAIDALADWHAAWWNDPPEAVWLPSLAEAAVRRQIQDNYDHAWHTHGPRLLEHAPAFEAIGHALVGRLEATLAPMATPATLIHGDAHAENIPLTDRGALLLDWQDPRIANPGLDLAVFTTMSYRAADRPARERYFVRRHADRLRAHGCEWPDPWEDDRLGLLRRAARIVEIADVDFVSLPWVFRRSALAAVEHEVGELIR
ncbi:MAG: aminoglycoside phosphotransferase family protein [Gammaproteobacteria bacterium]